MGARTWIKSVLLVTDSFSNYELCGVVDTQLQEIWSLVYFLKICSLGTLFAAILCRCSCCDGLVQSKLEINLCATVNGAGFVMRAVFSGKPPFSKHVHRHVTLTPLYTMDVLVTRL